MIYVTSRSFAVNNASSFYDCALISISGTHRDYTNTVPVDVFEDAIQVVFDDVLEDGSVPQTPAHRQEGWEGETFVPFNKEHAKKIIEFAEIHIEQSNDIIVHCDAGISRSVAVGKYLAEAYGLKVQYVSIGHDKFANQHIYSTLKSI